jgi:hypothetical protein
MTSADPTPTTAALGIQPTYSAREAAVLLGRSYIWFDQRLREDKFIRPDGTTVQPLRRQGGYRQFTLAMLEGIALSSYRHHWFSMTKLKWTYCELLMAAYRQTGEYKFGLPPLLSNPVAPDTGSARADVAWETADDVDGNPADDVDGNVERNAADDVDGNVERNAADDVDGNVERDASVRVEGTYERNPADGARGCRPAVDPLRRRLRRCSTWQRALIGGAYTVARPTRPIASGIARNRSALTRV